MVTIGGLDRFKLWNLLADARTHGTVEHHVWLSMREKLLPTAMLEPARLPGNPNALRPDIMAALPVEPIEFSPAEESLLLRGMNQFVTAPGVPGIDGKWFYPILEVLESSTKEKP